MTIFKKAGTKGRLFDLMYKVNKMGINESFDSPKDKDKEYLDKSKDQDDVQVSKYDGGVRYPVEDKLKVSDPSLEGLKGDDMPIKEFDDNTIEDEEKLVGGLADGDEVKDYDPNQIAKGIAIEMEHTIDPKVALEITMDHLKEIPDYYDHLESMENKINPEEDENQLLDPSKHWINHYSPMNVGDNDMDN